MIIIHVSPNGNDKADGSLTSPVKTLPAAQLLLRSMRDSQAYDGEATVFLHGGKYCLDMPLVFDQQDMAPTCWKAFEDEKVIITSARQVQGWQECQYNGYKAWQAFLPGVIEGRKEYRTLLVNGSQRSRTRMPKQGYYEIARVENIDFEKAETDSAYENSLFKGYDRFEVHEGDMQNFENLQDVEMVIPHYWEDEHTSIESYDPNTRTVVTACYSAYSLADDFVKRYARYCLENVKEALEPGLWYIDRSTGILTYLPCEGETLQNTLIEVCEQTQAILFNNTAYIRFEGITFDGFDWRMPKDKRQPIFDQIGKYTGCYGQAAYGVAGCVVFTNSHSCVLSGCTLTNIGGYAVEVSKGSAHINICHNEMHILGAGGVKINGATAQESPIELTHHIHVTDNHIYDCGRVYLSAIGILSMHSAYNHFSHNHIHDLYYTGISVGWVWGYTPSTSHHNIVEYNHIHDIGKGVLSDMGGIYTLGEQPGTIIRGNVIHDIQKRNYGGWGIYPDEGSSYMLIENNLCYHLSSQGFHQHYGKENIVRNNIFAFSNAGTAAFSRSEAHNSVNFYGNVFLSDGIPFYVCRFDNTDKKSFISDSNLFWNYKDGSFSSGDGDNDGQLTLEMHKTWDFNGWQSLGYDLHSMVADPCFLDAKSGDFTVTDPTNLNKIGFKLPNWSDVGPRKKD